jgi:hypothetical protein
MPLAPPTIVEELSVCSTAVRTSNQSHGARVELLIDGDANPIGGGTADWPDQWFPLKAGVSLQPNQLIRARQRIGGETSAASAVAAVVQDRSTTRPQFEAPLVFCSAMAVITSLAPAASVVVTAADGTPLGSTTAAGTRAVVTLSRIVLDGEVLSVSSSACGAPAGPPVNSPPAERMRSTADGRLLPPTLLGDVRACMRMLHFGEAQVGAILFLERDDGMVSYEVSAGDFYAEVDPELRPNEILSFWQETPSRRCQLEPSERIARKVDAGPPGPPRITAQPCPGARTIELDELVPTATVRILDGATEVLRFEAAKTSREVDLGGVALVVGQQLTVEQGLCGVFGAISPVPVSVTLPALDARPGIPEHLVECGGVVRVDGVAEGCLVEVFSDRLKGRIGHAFARGSVVDVLVSPPLLGMFPGSGKERVRVEVSGCAGGTAEREVDAAVDLPPFVVAIPIDGDRSVAVSELVPGSLVDVLVDGHWATSTWSGGRELRALVPHPLHTGQAVDVSVRLCSQRRSAQTVIVAAPLVLQWERPTSRGLQTDTGDFMAGRVQAVLALEGSVVGAVLVGTEESGLWTVQPGGPAFPLSMDWPTPLIRSLARGTRGPGHLFCGTNAGMLETDPAVFVPLLSWQRVNGLPGAIGVSGLPGSPIAGGTIFDILVLAGHNLIVVATGSGVWWSSIPATVAAGYVWSSDPVVDRGLFTALCEGPNESIVAYRAGAPGGGFAVGIWAPAGLQWTATTPGLSGAPADRRLGTVVSRMTNGALGSSPQDRRRVYAALADVPDANNNAAWLAVLRSDDGGQTWSIPYADPTLTFFRPFGTIDMGFQAERNLKIGVHPKNIELVLLAGRRGGLLGSSDGGVTWDANKWAEVKSGFHADCLSLSFDPGDPTGDTVLVGSDGGVFRSTDQGVKWDNTLNEMFPTLMFDAQSESETPALSASRGFPGLLVGALQDNGTVFLSGDGEPWRELFDGGDGFRAFFVTSDIALRGGNDAVDLKWSRWDGVKFTDPVPLAPPGDPASSQFLPIMGRIAFPAFKNPGTGEPLLAIAGDDPPTGDVYGLFDKGAATNPATDRLFWRKLGTVPSEISGLGSYSGRVVLIGTVSTHMYRLDVLTGSVTEIPLPGGLPPSRLRWLTLAGPATAFCLVGNTLMRTVNLTTWTTVPTPAGSTLAVLAVDYGLDPVGLIIAGSQGAWLSRDLGDTWRASKGLPAHPQANHLEVVDYGGAGRVAHLGTWNWSVWRARLG